MDPQARPGDRRVPGAVLHDPAEHGRDPVLVQQAERPLQLPVDAVLPRRVDQPLWRSRHVPRARPEPADRDHRLDRGHDPGHRGRVRPGPLPVQGPGRHQPAHLHADGHPRGRHGVEPADAVHRTRHPDGAHDDPHRAHHVLPVVRGGHRQGPDRLAGPAAGAGGGRPVRQRVPDLHQGHAAAGGPGHRGRCTAVVLLELRRLHHHQLQRQPCVGDLPDVRLGCRAARHTGADQRHRHRHVPGLAADRRRGWSAADAQGWREMRVLVVGSGGVGDAVARIAVERDFFDRLVVADYDEARARATVAAATARREGEARLVAARVDASSSEAVAALAREHGITHVLNAVDPRFVMPVFEGALAAGADYLDMAMSLSRPHPERPYEEAGEKLGDAQFAVAQQWEDAGRLALVGMGVEPGMSDVFARYAADHLFSEIEELGTRDGANLSVTNEDGEEIFAPSFSIWTTIEECLNPPVIWEKDRGWFTTPPFSEPEVFDFPEGIGPVECVNVEHEEVLLMPRWVDAKRVTFKYGLGDEFIGVLRTLHTLGRDRTEKVRVGGVEVSPRDVVAACLPDPATIGPRMTGKTCAGLWVTGTGKDGERREVYLYHVVDNAWAMREYGAQCVVWQTAVNPVVALELLATGVWSGAGVLGPEAFDAVPFLDLLQAPAPKGYGSAWGMQDR